MKDGKKVALIQGAFDIINRGHVKAFEYMKSLSKTSEEIYVIVALNSNELIKIYKQRDAVLPREQKEFIIKSLKYVDEVVKADAFSPIELLKKHDVDIYCFTEEWLATKKAEIKFMAEKPDWEIVFLPRFPGVVATSDIKRILLKEAQDGFMG